MEPGKIQAAQYTRSTVDTLCRIQYLRTVLEMLYMDSSTVLYGTGQYSTVHALLTWWHPGFRKINMVG